MKKSVLMPIIFVLVFIAGCGGEGEESRPGVPGATGDRAIGETEKNLPAEAAGEFRMTVIDTFNISGRGTVVTGRISSGSITVGDPVCIPMEAGGQAPAEVEGIEVFREVRERAAAGEDVGVLVGDVNHRKIAKGEDLVASCDAGKVVAGSDDPCDYLRNPEYQAFRDNDALNFTFDVPSGWTHRRGSSEMHGFVGANPEVRNIYIEYLVSPTAMPAETADQVRGASMTQHEPIEVGGETLKVWVNDLREDGVSNVALTLPGPDGARDTILRFRTEKDCPFEDLEALRNHVVASIRQR